jgi:hypothetical protein
LEVWEKERQGILRKRLSPAEKRRALKDLGSAPEPPREPLLTCPEPTFEGLTKLFAVGHSSLGIFSGEGGQFIGGYGMNAENRMKTAAGLSDLWDGSALRRTRSLDGVLYLPGRRLTLHLLAQPRVASLLLGDSLLVDQGLLSRLLVTAPPPASGTRTWHGPPEGEDPALAAYGARLGEILAKEPIVSDRRPGVLTPRVLPLTTEGERAWLAFAGYVEERLGPGGKYEPISGLANKLPEHAARLAAVVALVEDLERPALGYEELARGVTLARFYASEALRLYEAGSTREELVLARQVLEWLQGPWRERLEHDGWPGGVISLPDLYQNGPSRKIRSRAEAHRTLTLLEEHGYLRRLEGGGVVAGTRRRDVWEVVGG